MNEHIRIELGGMNSGAWDRVFKKFTNVVETAVDGLMADAPNETRGEAREFARDIADITNGWVRAKLEKAEIDNEVKLAEIAERFEKIKMLQVRRELAEVELADKRFEFWEKRITKVLKLLGFFAQCAVRDKDGNLTLVLTNEQLAHLQSHLELLGEEKVEVD